MKTLFFLGGMEYQYSIRLEIEVCRMYDPLGIQQV